MNIIEQIAENLQHDGILPFYIKMSPFQEIFPKTEKKLTSIDYQTNSYFILQLYKPINIYETSFKMV
jgi:hypothetical protein